MITDQYYVVIVSHGVEIDKVGPYGIPEERDDHARQLWNEVVNRTYENLFWLDVFTTDPDGAVHVEIGTYTGDSLELTDDSELQVDS